MVSMKRREHIWTVVLLFVVVALTGLNSTASERIHFAGDSHSTTLTAAVGDGRDYLLSAKAGQALTVTIESPAGVYFNVLPPGSHDAIVDSSATGETSWTGQLSRDGDYTIQVYRGRSAAQQSKNPSFTITLAVR